MDAQGRIIDENGQVVNMRQHHELKINEKSVKDMRTKELEKIMKFGKSSGPLQNQARRKFFDSVLEQQGPSG